jgi:hypothetical protein
VSDAPEVILATIPGVEIVATGEWNLSTGMTTFTTEDLAAAVDAAGCPSLGDPAIKLGHVDPRFDGEPRVGNVKNLTLTAGGNKITGDYSGMPAWLGEIMASAYPERSIEGTYGVICQQGHNHAFVITAVALLGVSAPGVGVLNGIEDIPVLYGIAAETKDLADLLTGHTIWKLHLEGGEPMAGSVVAQGITTEDVRRAYYDNPDTSYAMWITELQLDPLQLIVCDEGSGAVFRVPISAAKGELTFGDPVPVSIEYVDKPGDKPKAGTLRFASRDESRKGVTDPKAADEPEPPADTTPDPEAAAEPHGTPNGTHSHDHPAYGAQGGDETHSHSHTHAGDDNHAHAHATADNTKEGGTDVDFTDEQLASLRASLGLGEDDTELDGEALLAAVAQLKDKAESVKVGAARPLPPGVMTIEKEAWEGLNKRVLAGEEFRKKQLAGERDQVILAAIRAGKLSPAGRARWERIWDKDPEGTREILAGLPKNSFPVEDIGSPGGDDSDLMDEEYRSLFPPGPARSKSQG